MELIEEPRKYQLATCRTDGCDNAGTPIRVPDNGAGTQCGVCEEMITEFTPEPTT